VSSLFVTLEAIRDAAQALRGSIRRTPLIDVQLTHGRPLLLKCENLQLGGAFKIRGALNLIGRLTAREARRGVITYSSGNHGLAVALAAQRAGAPAVVVMPATAPAFKMAAVRASGAEVIVEGTTSMERRSRAEAEAAARGVTMVPPFDHPAIIAGQGTIGLELVDERPDLAEVWVPIGGGGLISGIAAAVKRLSPSTRVVGVEPEGAAKMTASLEARRPVQLVRASSIADGLIPVRPGDLTFAHVCEFVDEIVTVTDDEIVRAVGRMFADARLVVEPSGAAAYAALTRAREAGTAQVTAAAIVSGGNIGAGAWARLVGQA